MRYAIVKNEKVEAFKGGSGTCPICNSNVKAYCGELVAHHWKHKSNKDCDTWSEGMTQWHIDWQNCFPKEMQEITIKKNDITHRADVFNSARNLTIEFQNSPISSDKIRERESFYGKMVWVINGISSIDKISFANIWKGELFRYLKFPSNYISNNINPISYFGDDYEIFINKIYLNLLTRLTIDCHSTYQRLSETDRIEFGGNTLSIILDNNIKGKYERVSKNTKKIVFDIIERLNQINQDYLKAKSLFKIGDEMFNLIWKFRPKSWNESLKSKFIDIGDDNLYKIYDIDPFINILVVRKINKIDFLKECKKEIIEQEKKTSIINILIKSDEFKNQENSQIDILNNWKNKKEENNEDGFF